MSQREILLHVGHGKTGSSFIQSSLALSGAALAEAGIAYPINAKSEQAARAGHISSGNVGNVEGLITGTIRQGFKTGHERVLISSEFLFQSLLTKCISREFADLRAQFPAALVRVLLYVRDPLDHAVSVYQQRIKRGAFTGTFADSLDRYMIPLRVGQFVEEVNSAGVDITVLNYSRHTKALLGTFESWLGIPLNTLEKPPFETVNRSMTLAELELQRLFNVFFGKGAGRYVSDPLCNRLPEIRSEVPTLSRDALVAFLAQMEQMIAQNPVAVAIPASEAYRLPASDEVFGCFAPADAGSSFPYAFSSAQLQVIVEAIHSEVQRQLRSKGRVSKA